jgi:hypothetical protein
MLKRHAQFFDVDSDGKITVGNCYTALRSLRLNPFICGLGAILLPLGLGWKSGGNLIHIRVDGMESLLHAPNDTGGFSKPGGLVLDHALYTLEDIRTLITLRGGNPRTLVFRAEWGTMFRILNKFRTCTTGDGTPAMRREELERLFDGSLFFSLVGRPIPPL